MIDVAHAAPHSLAALRRRNWSDLPTSPGVYWWYFLREELDHFRIAAHSAITSLNLRVSDDGRVCLYHGMARNLAQRIKWHAAQPLEPSALRSGFLSTFRLSLLALNRFEYLRESKLIDQYIDRLSLVWLATDTVEAARTMEHDELCGAFHYPLNIQGNRRVETKAYVGYLKGLRKDYRARYLTSE